MSKIKWWIIAARFRLILGRKNYSKLQSFLKYLQRFYGEYHHGGKRTEFTRQTYVFMIDGKTLHGGLSDRLNGVFSLYGYCKKHNKDFKICWFYPFNLPDYLMPSSVDWKVEKSHLSFNLKDVDFKFFNSYSGLSGRMYEYYQLLDSKKREIHVYSNIAIEDNHYRQYFRELFVPSHEVQDILDRCIKEIAGHYISVTFRFIGLLGDFKDDKRWLKQNREIDVSIYVTKCLAFIQKLHLEYPQHRILVTSDSMLFLEEANKQSYVYIVPGNMVHMDCSSNDVPSAHLKPFVDFLMISHAERCFTYCVGNMYAYSRFAKTAALVGGKGFERVNG